MHRLSQMNIRIARLIFEMVFFFEAVFFLGL